MPPSAAAEPSHARQGAGPLWAQGALLQLSAAARSVADSLAGLSGHGQAGGQALNERAPKFDLCRANVPALEPQAAPPPGASQLVSELRLGSAFQAGVNLCRDAFQVPVPKSLSAWTAVAIAGLRAGQHETRSEISCALGPIPSRQGAEAPYPLAAAERSAWHISVVRPVRLTPNACSELTPGVEPTPMCHPLLRTRSP